MLGSIKSKIIILTISLLFVLGIVVASTAIIAFYTDKELIINGNKTTVTAFEEKLSTEIADLEKNAMDLALMAEIYYKNGKKQEMGEFFTKELLKNYPDSMGNGIWFEPYKISPTQRATCIHALWEEDGKIGFLPSCVRGDYDYFAQNWYAEIIQDLREGKYISWIRPYKSSQVEFLMTTVGVGIYDEDELVGIAMVDWQMDAILKSILRIKPTPNSFVLFADKANDCIIATTEQGINNSDIMGKSLKTMKWYSPRLKEGVPFEHQGKTYIPYIKHLNNGLFLVVNVPIFELFHDALHHLRVLLSVLLISTIIIVSIMYLVLLRNINRPISTLTEIAQKISQGDLDRTIQLDKPSELAKLANAFNKMKTDIKNQLMQLAKISGEKEKIESELAIARTIQSSALVHDFPKNKYFEIFASMVPAKEVSGDFYDFFAIDENRYAVVMADVSGKGITAALYMMSAKMIIKNMLQAGYPLEEAINKANRGLYDSHAQCMFVTAFIGILDIASGKLQYISAGHCPPLHKTKNGYEFVNVVQNLVLGASAHYLYKSSVLNLKAGERIFLYTDGVTEAQTSTNKMFGEERLKKSLNKNSLSLSDTLNGVHKDIQRFVRGAPQFDDITMLILEFRHKNK